jgi:hypothetical protein
MMFSSSIHLLANDKISFFFEPELNSVVYKYHIFVIHSSVVGYLDCFYNLTIVNSAAVKMGMQVTLEYPESHSFGYIPRTGIAGSYGRPVLSF